ncbi:unnamed protein product [Rotaria sp. Silwood1]|nr:unnamed protein product [Rotaria sp. Silwood1]CAF4859130.1 unnamed protein product [Rotaria sp. Silwood1]
MDDHSSHNCSCHLSSNINKGVYETLDELDFRRGLCGYTPLHYSVRFQPAHACRLLLEHGANPNCQTRASKSTPLHRAIIFNNIDAVNHLLEYKADLTLKDIDGHTPIEKAMTINSEIANILLQSQQSC